MCINTNKKSSVHLHVCVRWIMLMITAKQVMKKICINTFFVSKTTEVIYKFCYIKLQMKQGKNKASFLCLYVLHNVCNTLLKTF